MSEHTLFMLRALELARKAEGYTSPNPMVGAVMVRDGHIVGEGFHQCAGAPHAEVEALREAGDAARGATLYVSLEPCNHYGRTPPCTDAIINAGITRVVFATSDPNPHVAGGGAHRLQQAGIEVISGVCEEQAQELNRFFFRHARTGRPYLIAKFAASLDGKIATHTGHSQWITGAAARERGHSLRHRVDAILVGVGTVVADNPRLTTRLDQATPRHPIRIILDSTGWTPLDAHVLDPATPGQTIIATTSAMPHNREQALIAQNSAVEVLRLPATGEGTVDIGALLDVLGRRQVQSVLVEGGSRVLGTCVDSGYVNEVWAFLAPLIIGGQDALSPVGGIGCSHLSDALRLTDVTIEMVGDDVLIRGRSAPARQDEGAR